jgi:hypothetical protein
MQTTLEALMEGFELINPEGVPGYFSFKFGDGYELCFEPLLEESQMYVALYKDGYLLTNKVVIKPGKIHEEDKE